MKRYRSPQQRCVMGAGLENMGNTCYLNATLQCFTHMVPLVERLRSSNHPTLCCSDFCSLCALRVHVDICIKMSGGILRPVTFVRNLSKISSYFELGRQEDAQEFLTSLLDRLHDCCLDPSLRDHPSSSQQDSLVNQVFGGQLRSQLQCCECGHSSNTFETFIDISLEIGNADSIITALRSFTQVEKIEGKLTCGGCKAQVEKEKQLKLDQAPMVATLQLKRFKNDGVIANKIDKFVEYPLELDLRPYLSDPDDEEQTMYELYAVIVHEGSANSGHYYSMIRASQMDWYIMDDSWVVRVSETFALERQAYILFYIKQGTSPWFSSFMQSTDTPIGSIKNHDSEMTMGYRMDKSARRDAGGYMAPTNYSDPMGRSACRDTGHYKTATNYNYYDRMDRSTCRYTGRYMAATNYFEGKDAPDHSDVFYLGVLCIVVMSLFLGAFF